MISNYKQCDNRRINIVFDRTERQSDNSKTDISDLDAGLAIVLLTLLYGYFKTAQPLFLLPTGVLVFAMVLPRIFCWFAWLWSGLSQKMGYVATHVILTLIFFVILTPVSLITRLLRIDSLQLTSWKSNKNSFFKNRQHLYEETDFDHPY